MADRRLRSPFIPNTKTLNAAGLPADQKDNFSHTHTNQNEHTTFLLLLIRDLVRINSFTLLEMMITGNSIFFYFTWLQF